MWRRSRFRLSSVLFFIARYGGLTAAIISLFPLDVRLVNGRTCLRLVTIVSSDAVLAVRAWAIWERRRSVFFVIMLTAIACIAPSLYVLQKDVVSSKIAPPLNVIGSIELPDLDQCRYIESDVTDLWSVPYFLVISFETLTLAITLIPLVRWHARIPKAARSPLLATLWKDGVIYFIFMLMLSIVNIGLVFQVKLPELRSGGSQLQTCLHSMVSSRIILHLASSTVGPKHIEDSTVLSTFRTMQFVDRRTIPDSDFIGRRTDPEI